MEAYSTDTSYFEMGTSCGEARDIVNHDARLGANSSDSTSALPLIEWLQV
jgi:hypothetical protein